MTAKYEYCITVPMIVGYQILRMQNNSVTKGMGYINGTPSSINTSDIHQTHVPQCLTTSTQNSGFLLDIYKIQKRNN